MATTNCPVCGQHVGIDSKGKIHLHQKPGGGKCSGSGKKA